MTAKRALLVLIALTVGYVAVLLWADSRNDVFNALPRVVSVLPPLLGLSLLSYGVRYLRWRWLLRRYPHDLTPWGGLLAYVAGFAFTASPGKAGELLRIRYHAGHGVTAPQVFSAFLFERSADLVAVLLLSLLAVTRPDVLVITVGFVVVFLAAVWCVALNPVWLTQLAAGQTRRQRKRAARFIEAARDGFSGCRIWLTPQDISVSLLLGLAAWGVTSMAFVLLLGRLGVTLPWASALSTYPQAMLAGAASMLPAGIGSTELAIVALLAPFGISLETAILAAVAIRFATLWFAIFCGLVSISVLEARRGRKAKQPAEHSEQIKHPTDIQRP